MKTKLFLLTLILCAGIFSCDSDDEIVDPIYEFVAFDGNSSVNLNEFEHSEAAYPLVANLLAFKPHDQDIDLTLEITSNNAAENTDFIITPHDVLKIRAGSLTSDTLWIETVDNATSTALERTFTVKIKSSSEEGLKIGLGITEPENAAITFKILDDECSLTTAIYNGNLKNTVDESTELAVVGAVTASTVKLTGDLMNYSTFSNASLTVTLTPASAGATKGKATFGEQETGTDNDGYKYKFVEDGEGSYDVCSGTISIKYDIYYEDGGWVYWYSVSNLISVP